MKPMHATTAALGLGVSLLLAACGGRGDDPPAAPGEQQAQGPDSRATPLGAAPPAAAVAQQAETTAAPGNELTELQRQVAQLRREVADLRTQVARLPGGNAPTAADAPPHPHADPQARAEAERSEALRLAGIEQAFRNEPRDARWSQGATASVQAALAEADDALRGQVRSVECRGQSCRVEIADNATAARDLPLLINRLGQTLPKVTAGHVDQGDGRQATVLYLAR